MNDIKESADNEESLEIEANYASYIDASNLQINLDDLGVSVKDYLKMVVESIDGIEAYRAMLPVEQDAFFKMHLGFMEQPGFRKFLLNSILNLSQDGLLKLAEAIQKDRVGGVIDRQTEVPEEKIALLVIMINEIYLSLEID